MEASMLLGGYFRLWQFFGINGLCAWHSRFRHFFIVEHLEVVTGIRSEPLFRVFDLVWARPKRHFHHCTENIAKIKWTNKSIKPKFDLRTSIPNQIFTFQASLTKPANLEAGGLEQTAPPRRRHEACCAFWGRTPQKICLVPVLEACVVFDPAWSQSGIIFD